LNSSRAGPLCQPAGATLWVGMVDSIRGVKHIAAKLAPFDGAYLRFVGEMRSPRYRSGELVETHWDDAIWN